MNDERALLSKTSAHFIQAAWPLGRVRDALSDHVGAKAWEREYLRPAADLGWFAFFVPEQFGGGAVSAERVLDAVAVGQERGRVLQPASWVDTNVVADALSRAGSNPQQAELLPKIVTGTVAAAWVSPALFEPHVAVLCAEPAADTIVLNGTARGVGCDVAGVLLVSAMLFGELRQFVVPGDTAGITYAALESLDLTRSASEISFVDVVLPADALLGGRGASPDGVDQQLGLGALLSVSETVGALERLFDMTVRYAKERVAFGRPIGAFQAVKHALADMSLQVECCKAGLMAAARAWETQQPWRCEVVNIVKSFVADSSTDIAQGCLQLHGGIGYTWEHDLHLFYRRLATDAAMWGDASWHRERICAAHGL